MHVGGERATDACSVCCCSACCPACSLPLAQILVAGRFPHERLAVLLPQACVTSRLTRHRQLRPRTSTGSCRTTGGEACTRPCRRAHLAEFTSAPTRRSLVQAGERHLTLAAPAGAAPAGQDRHQAALCGVRRRLGGCQGPRRAAAEAGPAQAQRGRGASQVGPALGQGPQARRGLQLVRPGCPGCPRWCLPLRAQPPPRLPASLPASGSAILASLRTCVTQSAGRLPFRLVHAAPSAGSVPGRALPLLLVRLVRCCTAGAGGTR